MGESIKVYGNMPFVIDAFLDIVNHAEPDPGESATMIPARKRAARIPLTAISDETLEGLKSLRPVQRALMAELRLAMLDGNPLLFEHIATRIATNEPEYNRLLDQFYRSAVSFLSRQDLIG